ncbi:MAG: alpha/beta fold hydrolase [Nitriliruptoraceae bacterium]|nr:alpha/beta fold hydrolase [Nitriliruptoraceae bacterium]
MPQSIDAQARPGPELAYPDSRFETFAGVEVHHKVSGSTDAPTVLLSHHFYGSVPTWRHVMADLGDDHQVVAFDRPGFGLTERPARADWGGTNPYTRETSARIGWELLESLDAGEDVVLVGSSAGGTNVLEMYARHPERVRALVLLSPAITGDVGPPDWLRPVLRGPQGRALAPLIVRRIARSIDVERVASAWADPSRATGEDAEPYQRMTQVDGWELGFWELVNAEPRPDLREVVRAIDVPTLVVTGDRDRVIAPRWNQRTAAAIDGARFEVLDNCGHTPQEECPDALVEVIRGFLTDVDA